MTRPGTTTPPSPRFRVHGAVAAGGACNPRLLSIKGARGICPRVLLFPIVLCSVIMSEPPQPPSPVKYTQDQQLPGAFEGETITRRRLMNRTALATGAVAAAAFTLPALGFAIAPVFQHTPDTWQAVGPVSHFSDADYRPEVI